MPKIVDHTGKKFGRLTVLRLAGLKGKDRACVVECECGTIKEVVQSKLTTKTKAVRSCGCLAKDNHHRTHSGSSHKWYSIWNAMIGRCYRESQKSFKDYGGRGITVCDEWKEGPNKFYSWLEAHGYEKGKQIDRRDNDKIYTPENCRIVDRATNCNNRRDNVKFRYNGQDRSVAQIAESEGMKYSTLYMRLKRGKTLERAICDKLR